MAFDYSAYLSLIQIAVALNFGFLYLEKHSVLIEFQKGFLQTIAQFFHKDMKLAEHEYSRVRNTMSEDILNLKKVLKDETGDFKGFSQRKLNGNDNNRENNSVYLPSLGFVSGIYSIFLLYAIPLIQKTKSLWSIDLLSGMTQATVFSILISIIFIYFKDFFKQRYVAVIYSILWLILALAFYFILWKNELLWRIIKLDVYIHFAIIVSYVPIIWYILQLMYLVLVKIIKVYRIRRMSKELRNKLEDIRKHIRL